MIQVKKTILAVVALFTVFCLFSCHGGTIKEKFEMPLDFDTEKQYEITFWAKNESNINQADIYRASIENFNKIYPNIKVNLNIYTDYSRIYNDVITNLATDTTPNVCITYPDHIATYITGKNTVVALDELLYDERFGLGGSEVAFDAPTAEEIVPEFLEECRIGNKYYALPFMRSTEVCYINKDYVEKLGFTLPEVLTWEFMFEVAEAATQKDETGNYLLNGQKVLIPIIYKSTDNMMIQMLKQMNAGYSDEHGNIKIFNDITKSLLYDISFSTKTGAFSTFKIAGYPANFLNAGQCIFAIDSTAGSTWMGSDAPLIDISEDKLVDFETAVMPVPQYDTSNISMISQGPSVCIFNKEDKAEVLASWLFVQYLLSNDVQIPYSQTEGYLPVTTKAQESPEYQDYLSKEGMDNDFYYDIKIKTVKLLMENTENTFVTPVFNGSASLRNAAGQLIENVTKSTRRKEKIDDAYMTKLFSDVTTLYRLDSISDVSSLDDESGDSVKQKVDIKEKIGKEELPYMSKILLASLALIWFFIILYVVKEKRKSKK